MTPEDRQRQRELLAAEEAEHKARQEKGILEPVLDAQDEKLLQAVIKIGTIAKKASRTKVAIRAYNDEGKLVTLEERIAHEEIILATLLNQRLNSLMEAGR